MQFCTRLKCIHTACSQTNCKCITSASSKNLSVQGHFINKEEIAMKHLAGFAEKNCEMQLWNAVSENGSTKWLKFIVFLPVSHDQSWQMQWWQQFCRDVSAIAKSQVCSLTSPHKILSLYILEVLPTLETIYCLKKGSGPWKHHE